jgi:hypothetical protein
MCVPVNYNYKKSTSKIYEKASSVGQDLGLSDCENIIREINEAPKGDSPNSVISIKKTLKPNELQWIAN